ncbi:hypothetical protein BZA70DRAFT_86696 [Myxozyma melibiosi]|uniref:BZIP domain-containing protein n=1 Tax=Myxozyma melibiosi TaxID=54550 RepID=A0ABR1EZ93_9ASCO
MDTAASPDLQLAGLFPAWLGLSEQPSSAVEQQQLQLSEDLDSILDSCERINPLLTTIDPQSFNLLQSPDVVACDPALLSVGLSPSASSPSASSSATELSSSSSLAADETSKSAKPQTSVTTTVAIQKRKRGRPRVFAEQEHSERRRAQVRDAQRTYRQKKDLTIQHLQRRVRSLESVVESIQSVFLDVYDSSLEHAIEYKLGNDYIRDLAFSASRVLDLTQAALDNSTSESDATPTVPEVNYIAHRPTYSGPDSRLFDTTPVFEKFPIPQITSSSVALSTRVLDRNGTDRYEKLQEALFRSCFLIAKNTLATKNPTIIARIFPEGLDNPDRTYRVISAALKRTDRIDPSKWYFTSDDNRTYPRYISTTAIARKVKLAEEVDKRGPFDLDALVSSLYGRGVSLGNCPRYYIFDVEMALSAAEKVSPM